LGSLDVVPAKKNVSKKLTGKRETKVHHFPEIAKKSFPGICEPWRVRLQTL